jgi:hypothetical protein
MVEGALQYITAFQTETVTAAWTSLVRAIMASNDFLYVQ